LLPLPSAELPRLPCQPLPPGVATANDTVSAAGPFSSLYSTTTSSPPHYCHIPATNHCLRIPHFYQREAMPRTSRSHSRFARVLVTLLPYALYLLWTLRIRDAGLQLWMAATRSKQLDDVARRRTVWMGWNGLAPGVACSFLPRRQCDGRRTASLPRALTDEELRRRAEKPACLQARGGIASAPHLHCNGMPHEVKVWFGHAITGMFIVSLGMAFYILSPISRTEDYA